MRIRFLEALQYAKRLHFFGDREHILCLPILINEGQLSLAIFGSLATCQTSPFFFDARAEAWASGTKNY